MKYIIKLSKTDHTKLLNDKLLNKELYGTYFHNVYGIPIEYYIDKSNNIYYKNELYLFYLPYLSDCNTKCLKNKMDHKDIDDNILYHEIVQIIMFKQNFLDKKKCLEYINKNISYDLYIELLRK